MDLAAIDASRTSATEADMRPVVFDGCFGWLHSTKAGATANAAVVLCPGLSFDEMTGYRSLRLLGDGLAKAGYPTLRFHTRVQVIPYHCDAVEPWADLLRSIHSAADWLRDNGRVGRLVLLGLRVGATLAALVAENRPDVAGLVLLAPVLRGRTYIRQLIVECARQLSAPPTIGGLSVDRLQFSGETVRMINQLDLRRVVLPPRCQVAVFSQTPDPSSLNVLRLGVVTVPRYRV